MKSHIRRNVGRIDQRSAFSLVEVMVVLIIISILMALLLPALGRARVTAKIAEIQAGEFEAMKASLTEFKTASSDTLPAA
jgi:prepilin-type N-terminal cleavage/methylation domain-containing protein